MLTGVDDQELAAAVDTSLWARLFPLELFRAPEATGLVG
jgi:hypothetical protein